MSSCFDVVGRESGVWVDVDTNDGQRTPVHLFLLLVWYAKRIPQVEQAFFGVLGAGDRRVRNI